MNILLMARIIAKTGVGNHVKQLSEELINQGHKVWVVASTNEMDIGKTNGGVLFELLAPGDRDHILSGVFNQFLSALTEPVE